MALVCFNLGGTIIDDPFPKALDALLSECLSERMELPFSHQLVEVFFDFWREENWEYDFSFASHFLQEEIWPIRAASRLVDYGAPHIFGHIPLFVPKLLSRYREFAKDEIRRQTHLANLRQDLETLRNKASPLVVASNDREFATGAMLEWAGLSEYFSYIFSSEGLSRKYQGAEKPAQEFFRAIIAELRHEGHTSDTVVYVGDSETKDIRPAKKVGCVTLRYVNKRSPTYATWLSNPDETSASYWYEDFDQLLPTLMTCLSSRQ